jgi:hypothetical protein
MQRIFKTWWPLAASWLLMGAEGPALAAIAARLPNAEVNLAAYGGVVFPLALVIEAPIIMLLAASTALSKDWASYKLVRRYMMTAGAGLTLLHILVAFTPLYYLVVNNILGVPEEIVEPARIGMMIMTPWTWSIAYRRFNQGVMIRFGRSKSVGIGTAVRLSVDLLVLVTGYLIGTIPGIVVATCAVAGGVISEAIYSGIVVQPIVSGPLKNSPPVAPPLSWPGFWKFYIPLMLTSLLMLLANPIGSAALSRMPEALSSLAVWPVLTGLIFILRAPGIALNEVVVALLDERHSYPNLRRFTNILAFITTGALLMLAATPLSSLWFGKIVALPPHLIELAVVGIWIALPLPALSSLQSWYQGAILHGRRTRGLTESVLIYLFTSTLILGFGVAWGGAVGLYIGITALTLSVLTQTAWLWVRSRPIMQQLRQRDAAALETT